MSQDTTQTTGTVRLQRFIKAPAQRIYDAFLDADCLGKFMPPGGYTGRFERADGTVGGRFHGSFTSIDKKEHHAFGGAYLELDPPHRIVHTDAFETDEPELQGEMRVTITLEEQDGGTLVTVVQEGIPAVIPPSDAQTGWGMTMENLARLVEMPGA